MEPKKIKIISNIDGQIKINRAYEKASVHGIEYELDKIYENKKDIGKIMGKTNFKVENGYYFWYYEDINTKNTLLEVKKPLDTNNHIPSFLWGQMLTIPQEFIGDLEIQLKISEEIYFQEIVGSNSDIQPSSDEQFIGLSNKFPAYFFIIRVKPSNKDKNWKIIVYPNLIHADVAHEYLNIFYNFNGSKWSEKSAINERYNHFKTVLSEIEKEKPYIYNADKKEFMVNEEVFKFNFPE